MPINIALRCVPTIQVNEFKYISLHSLAAYKWILPAYTGGSERRKTGFKIKVQIFHIAVMPGLLYEAEKWTRFAQDLQKLKVFQKSYLKTILGISCVIYDG